MFCLLTISIFSCSKEEERDCSNLMEIIVGTWEVSTGDSGVSSVTFNADGSMVDANGAFIELNGETTNKWELDTNNRLIVGIADNSDDGYSAMLNPMTTIIKSCDEIDLSLFIFTVNMKR